MQQITKGFYQYKDLQNVLERIKYKDYFCEEDKEDFACGSARTYLCGNCMQFAACLEEQFEYEIYIIKSNTKGMHAFCRKSVGEKIYYIDVRGVTSSFDLFIQGLLIEGEYVIRKMSFEERNDMYTEDEKYADEYRKFAERIILEYRKFYTI